MLRRKQPAEASHSLDTFFTIELKLDAPQGASLFAGPYLELEHAAKILLDHPELILNQNFKTMNDVTIGYIYECYFDNGLRILDIRAEEVYKC